MASTAQTEPGRLYTLGYEGLTVSDLAEWLEETDVRVWDVRYTPYSARAEWCKTPLQKRLGDRYMAAGQWFGNRNHGDPELPIHIVRPMLGAQMLNGVLASGTSVALMCYERSHEKCHRAVVAGIMLGTYDVVCSHLVIVPAHKHKGQRQLW